MDYTNLKERMEKSIGDYQEKLSEIRAGRANPAILNKITITPPRTVDNDNNI